MRIKTADGLGVVVETNILENKIKVRLVIEEKTKDRPEKLSTDIYTHRKEEITRLEAKASKDPLDDIDEALLDEIKELLEE